MKCPDCDKRLHTLYVRKGADAVFTKVGMMCLSCKMVIWDDKKL